MIALVQVKTILTRTQFQEQADKIVKIVFITDIWFVLKNSELNEKVVLPYAKHNITLFDLHKIFCLCDLIGRRDIKIPSITCFFLKHMTTLFVL